MLLKRIVEYLFAEQGSIIPLDLVVSTVARNIPFNRPIKLPIPPINIFQREYPEILPPHGGARRKISEFDVPRRECIVIDPGFPVNDVDETVGELFRNGGCE